MDRAVAKSEIGGEALLYNMQPSRRHAQGIALMAILIVLTFGATLPWRHEPLARLTAFIPVVDTVLALSDLITAALLCAQGFVMRSRALILLAAGYLFTALIIIPHALTFPEAFSPTGLLGANVNTTIWLYYFWHAGLPIAAIVYAIAKRQERTPDLAPLSIGLFAWIAATSIAALAVGLTLLTTVGHGVLPPMMSDSINWSPHNLLYVAIILLALLLTAMTMLWRGGRSILDLWLLIALWAWLIELLLVIATSSRYSLGWYSGRIAGLVSGVCLLFVLLVETSRLYARLALSIEAERRERESRLVSIDTVAAAIAHEIKQPLAAMVAKAGAGLRWIARSPPELGEATALLAGIVDDGHRASDVISSIRGMIIKQQTARQLVHINDLIRDTTHIVSQELDNLKIELKLDLSADIPPIHVNRLQAQQVLLNLFANAMDALRGVRERRRMLIVRSIGTMPDSAVIEVEDTGEGIDAAQINKIFDPFVTSKMEGIGLGLALCRSIVEAHGGDLWVSHGRKYGAIFHIRLPAGDGEP